MIFDVCVVGPITKDVVIVKGKKGERIGGTVYYSSLTLKKFNLNVCIFTKLNKNDLYLLKELDENNIKIFYKFSKETEIFYNIYEENVDKRIQEVYGTIEKIKYEDIKDINAKVFYFGPLLKEDIDINIYEILKKEKDVKIVLDIQGYLREKINNKIILKKLEDISFLEYIDILKLNEEEAKIISGKDSLEEAGKFLSEYSKEVVITAGSKGSIICYNKKTIKIPVFKPRKVIDSTGCGDIYTSVYLAMRLKGFSPESSGLLASIVSGINVEKGGFYIPFEFKF